MAEQPKRRRSFVRFFSGLLLLAGLLVLWFETREPPEIARSRGIKLGMTKSEVEAVMGRSRFGMQQWRNGSLEITSFYGRTQDFKQSLYDTASAWLGLDPRFVPPAEWPVRVQYDGKPPNGRVDRIGRGDETEEAIDLRA